jgi:ligand-binding sensor domain-containing protein
MKQILLFIIVLLTVATARSQNPEWINYTNSDYANKLADAGDYLWLGTDGGLTRFKKSDGSLVCFTKANSSLPSHRITSLHVDKSGSVWVGTSAGLALFNGKRWTTFTSANSILPSDYINCIATGPDSTIWIGTDLGLVTHKNGQWAIYGTQNSPLPDPMVQAVLPMDNGSVWVGCKGNKIVNMHNFNLTDSFTLAFQYSTRIQYFFNDINGDLWISTNGGLGKYNGQTIELFTDQNSPLPQLNIKRVLRDSQGDLWIGTCCGGLVHWADTNWTIYNPISLAIPTSCLNDMLIDQNNRFWIASWAGLLEFTQGVWTRYPVSNSLLPQHLSIERNTIITDLTGTTWLGTDEGLYGYASPDWVYLPLNDSGYFGWGSPAYIKSLAVDDNNVLWAGTIAELIRVENGQWTIYDLHQTWGIWGIITSMVFDQNGNLWAIMSGELYRYDGVSWLKLDAQNSGYTGGLPYSYPTLIFDPFNVLWIIEYGKITKYDGNVWTTYDQNNSPISAMYLNSGVVDSSGVLWVGTHDNGLLRFDGTFWDFYTPDNSPFPLKTVRALSIDQDQNLWASGQTQNSLFAGVVMYDRCHTIHHYTSANSPLPDNSVYQINIDKANNKWFVLEGNHGVTVHNASGIQLSTTPMPYNASSVIYAWPNPFSDFIRIEIPGQTKEMTWRIMDVQGRLIQEGSLMGNSDMLDTRGLPAGVYLLTVKGQNSRQSLKIVKTRE